MQHTSLPIPVQLVAIYVSPKCKFQQLIHELDDFMRDTDHTCDTIVIGDFNMKTVSGVDQQYNTKLEQHIKNRYNFNQVVQENTSNYASVFDLCFTRIKDKCHMELLVRSQNFVSSIVISLHRSNINMYYKNHGSTLYTT